MITAIVYISSVRLGAHCLEDDGQGAEEAVDDGTQRAEPPQEPCGIKNNIKIYIIISILIIS